ncbi:MAG: thioredoxin family protein [Anaerolineales bacterium]
MAFRRVALSLTFLIGLLLLLVLSPSQPAQAQTATPENKIVIYFFWGDGCPHCANAKPFLEELKKNHPQVEVRAYEVWYVDENQELLKKMAATYGFEATAVPTFFIGTQYWVGYNDTIKAQIEKVVNTCLVSSCPDPGTGIDPNISSFNDNSTSLPATTQSQTSPSENSSSVIDVPILGKINLETQPLFLSTLIISFVDGFNPCSVWVLTMLLALTLHTGSRKKVIIIGLVFLTITALVYALFIAGLFTIFTFTSFVGWVQIVVSLVALFFALVNIKDYFWYKEGVSFTISDEKKPGIFQRMRKITDASQSLWGLISATVVLAAGVSLVEFSCTAGFPVLWTNLLASQKVGAAVFIALLVVYMVIYQLDELVIFFASVFTLRASKLEEKQGRILKLIGGMLMLTLAIVMLVNPSIMNNVSSSLVVFAIALGSTSLVLLLHRAILPRFGIRIGSELTTSKGKTRRKRR